MDIASIIIQAVAATATAFGVWLSLHQIRSAKKVELEKRERAQAEVVAAWMEIAHADESLNRDERYMWEYVCLNNASSAPVYEVIITCVGVQGAGPKRKGEEYDGSFDCRAFVGVLPPGSWSIWLPTYGRGMGIVLSVEIAFRDSSGISWVRRANGELNRLDRDPAQFYGIGQPIPWDNCTRI